MGKFELNDKVRVIASKDPLFGRTGEVSSILTNTEMKNIGVDIDWDGGDPKPYYYNEDELELVTEELDEEDY